MGGYLFGDHGHLKCIISLSSLFSACLSVSHLCLQVLVIIFIICISTEHFITLIIVSSWGQTTYLNIHGNVTYFHKSEQNLPIFEMDGNYAISPEIYFVQIITHEFSSRPSVHFWSLDCSQWTFGIASVHFWNMCQFSWNLRIWIFWFFLFKKEKMSRYMYLKMLVYLRMLVCRYGHIQCFSIQTMNYNTYTICQKDT